MYDYLDAPIGDSTEARLLVSITARVCASIKRLVVCCLKQQGLSAIAS